MTAILAGFAPHIGGLLSECFCFSRCSEVVARLEAAREEIAQLRLGIQSVALSLLDTTTSADLDEKSGAPPEVVVAPFNGTPHSGATPSNGNGAGT